MNSRRLPKRLVFGNLEGAVRRGQGGKEKEWPDFIQRDIRAFAIAGDWKVTRLKAEVWVETITEGRRRFMAAYRKEEVDAVINQTGKVVIVHGSVELCEATPFDLVNESKESL